MSEKTIENDFDKAVEFIVESDFNKNLNKCLDIVKELDKKDKEIERLNNIIDKAIEYIENHKLDFKQGTTTFGSERLSMEERKLLDILRGEDNEYW